MTFSLLPTVEVMLGLYRQPLGQARFQAYLRILQGGSKGDLEMPVSWYNPMAKEPVVDKLVELQQLGAEEILAEACMQLNLLPEAATAAGNYKVALNLADDLLGGWTNRYTTDYDSKFRVDAFLKRHFCLPVCWSGETFTASLIRERTVEYGCRTLYRMKHPAPRTLADIINQERFVARHSSVAAPSTMTHLPALEAFFLANSDSTYHPLIFNFLYGDAASASLRFPCHGIAEPFAGFAFAKATAWRNPL